MVKLKPKGKRKEGKLRKGEDKGENNERENPNQE